MSHKNKKKRSPSIPKNKKVKKQLVKQMKIAQRESSRKRIYLNKVNLLKQRVFDEKIVEKIGINPAGKAGYVVFLSICNKKERAMVYEGKGDTLNTAWNEAVVTCGNIVEKTDIEPCWLKVDVVYASMPCSSELLSESLKLSRENFFRNSLSFDPEFRTALLEAELNGNKIYDYKNNTINKENLDRYLKQAHKRGIESLPDQYTLFRCFGWLCDENNDTYDLEYGEYNYGLRKLENIDDKFIKHLIINASDFLRSGIQDDGSFTYGYYPDTHKKIDTYNILRHVGTIWALLCRYRLTPDESLKSDIDKCIDYLYQSIIFSDQHTAFVLEKKNNEIKLGGNALTIIILTEYMDVFNSDAYIDICSKLGNGILKQLDYKIGKYYHVLDKNFSRKEEFRTVYYDGEATFALVRLYGVTKDNKWLEAASIAVDHFIEADYTQFRDHWVAYSMNEITKYVDDCDAYYKFVLSNITNNFDIILNQDTTYHTYLELLMASFNTCYRMIKNQVPVDPLEMKDLVNLIKYRVLRQMEGYFYPEYAMYMKYPEKNLGAFMIRHDDYRIRIDDIQHNIGGLYQYVINYKKLVECGLDKIE